MPIRLSLPKPKKEWRYLVTESELSKYTKAGFKLSPHKLHGKYVAIKRKPEWEKFEDEIVILFRYGLKLTDVNGGAAFRIGEYQIDAVGGIEDTLLVVECKSKKELGHKPLRSALRTFWVKRRGIAGSLRRKVRRPIQENEICYCSTRHHSFAKRSVVREKEGNNYLVRILF